MTKNLLACISLYALFVSLNIAIAEDLPAGHFIHTHYGSEYVSACSVKCYRLDFDWENPQYWSTGFTGPGGHSDYSPSYSTCRFVEPTYLPPGYEIKSGENRAYVYYAFKMISDQMYYSEWSATKPYLYLTYYACIHLYLTRTSPPAWPPEE